MECEINGVSNRFRVPLARRTVDNGGRGMRATENRITLSTSHPLYDMASGSSFKSSWLATIRCSSRTAARVPPARASSHLAAEQKHNQT